METLKNEYKKNSFITNDETYYLSRIDIEGLAKFKIVNGKDEVVLESYIDTKEAAQAYSSMIDKLVTGLIEMQDFVYQNYINK